MAYIIFVNCSMMMADETGLSGAALLSLPLQAAIGSLIMGRGRNYNHALGPEGMGLNP